MQDNALARVRQSYVNRLDDSTRYNSLKPSVLAQSAERRRVLARVISEYLEPALSDAKVLDIGCGDGRDLTELLWLGATAELIAGNDLLESRLEVARQRLPATVKLVAGDIRAAGFESDFFDMVTLSVVLMTIVDSQLRAEVLNHAFSLVKPGGLLVVTEPIVPNPRNSDVVRISQRELIKVLGLEPVDSRRLHLVPPLSKISRFPTLYVLISAAFPFLKFHKLWVFKNGVG